MAIVKNILIELRSRLQSCNVYITTDIDLLENCNLNVNIQSNKIILNYCSQMSDSRSYSGRSDSFSSVDSFSDDSNDLIETIILGDHCKFIPNSMSGLKIDKNNVSFRLLTQPKSGEFHTEFIKVNTACVKQVERLKTTLNEGSKVMIMCRNCQNRLVDSYVSFRRILELPSENLDVTDWFCHNHGSTSNDSLKLMPNSEDFFYRLTYLILNLEVISKNALKFNMKRQVFHCNRCLAWLGMLDDKKQSLKLFNSTVSYEEEHTKESKSFFDCENDFIYSVEYLAKDFNIGMQYTVMTKIVLKCKFSATITHYMLLWLVDRDLEILKMSDKCNTDEEIKLLKCNSMKILFKIEESLNDFVENWLLDPYVVSADISKPTFNAGVKYLHEMSKNVPKAFRQSDVFTVTYLKL